jgi:hypothetical protein
MKTKFLFLGLALSLMIFSCTKKDDAVKDEFTADEAGINAKIDGMNDDVSTIVEDQFQLTLDNTSGKSPQNAESPLPACATVTRVPALGTPITVGQLVTKTIDFGTTGCPMPNGNVLKGKIIITFTFQPNALSHTVTYTFENFYHNLRKIDGTKTFTRTMTAASATTAPHPIVTMLMDMTVTFPDGRVFTRVGTRSREFVEGFATPLILSDNVYKVTGNWTTTFPNTTIQTSTITTPLIVKLSCNHIVQGVITFVRNASTATLDYGTGACDNIAVFTINGVAYTITLGN